MKALFALVVVLQLGPLQIDPARIPDTRLELELEISGWPALELADAAAMAAIGCEPVAGDGSADDGARLNCAFDRAPEPSRLVLPAGRFRVLTGLRILERRRLALIGAGVAQTQIWFTHERGLYVGNVSRCGNFAFFHICGKEAGWRDAFVPWTGGHGYLEQTLELASVDSLEVGDWVWLKIDDNRTLHPRDQRCCEYYSQWAARIVALDARARTVEIDRGVTHPFSHPSARGHALARFTPASQIVIRGIHFLREHQESDSAFVRLQHVAQVVLEHSRFEHGGQSAISFRGQAARVVIRHNGFVDFDDPDATGHVMIDGGHGALDADLYDNFFLETKGAIEFQLGGSRNFAAYNYIAERSEGCAFRHLFWHGNLATENLAEGNHIECTVELDDHWGPQGWLNTLYRNRIVSRRILEARRCLSTSTAGDCLDDANRWDGRLSTENLSGSRPVAWGPINVLLNIAPDIWGRPFCSPRPPSGCQDFDSDVPEGVWLERNVAAGVIRENAPQPTSRLIENAVQRRSSGARPASWDGFCEDPGLPNSLIWQSRPSWWCQESIELWRAATGIGACGDDLFTELAALPAQRRAEGLSCKTGPLESRPSPPVLLEP